MSALANFGICLIVVSTINAWAWILLRSTPGLIIPATAIFWAVVAAAALAANLGGGLPRWEAASAASMAVQSRFERYALPLLKCGSMQYVLATDVPLATEPGYYVFENPTALTSMLVARTECPSAAAEQVDTYRIVKCTPSGIEVPEPPNGSPSLWPYAGTIWLDTDSAVIVSDRSACERLALNQPGVIPSG